jgi:hypothetical protein
MIVCFHCGGLDLICTCLACHDEICVACRNRKRNTQLMKYCEDHSIDVRDSKNWICMKPEAPAHPFRRLAIEAALSKT